MKRNSHNYTHSASKAKYIYLLPLDFQSCRKSKAIKGGTPPRGTPTPGSWSGVGSGNYSDVGGKCLDCAEEKRITLEGNSQIGS